MYYFIADQQIPWLGAGVGIILGVIVVIADYVFTNKPTLTVYIYQINNYTNLKFLNFSITILFFLLNIAPPFDGLVNNVYSNARFWHC